MIFALLILHTDLVPMPHFYSHKSCKIIWYGGTFSTRFKGKLSVSLGTKFTSLSDSTTNNPYISLFPIWLFHFFRADSLFFALNIFGEHIQKK